MEWTCACQWVFASPELRLHRNTDQRSPAGSTSSHSNVRFANWSCYNSSNGMEPNNSGNEDYLQLNGGAKGGGMWNDLRVNQGTGTGVYHIKGYYIEYGGPVPILTVSQIDNWVPLSESTRKNAHWLGSSDEKRSWLQHHGNHGRHWHRQCRRPRDVHRIFAVKRRGQSKQIPIPSHDFSKFTVVAAEADLANHGLGITDAQPACLVDYDASTNTFQSTCDGGLVSVPSPGIVTCRDDPDSDDALLTLTYRVTATELAAANTDRH